MNSQIQPIFDHLTNNITKFVRIQIIAVQWFIESYKTYTKNTEQYKQIQNL